MINLKKAFGTLMDVFIKIKAAITRMAHLISDVTKAITVCIDQKDTEETPTNADPNELATSTETDKGEASPGESKTKLSFITATVIIVVFTSTAFIVCCLTQPPEVVHQLLHTIETLANLFISQAT